MDFFFNIEQQTMIFGGMVPLCFNTNWDKSQDLDTDRVILGKVNKNNDSILKNKKARVDVQYAGLVSATRDGIIDYHIFEKMEVVDDDFTGASGGIKRQVCSNAEKLYISSSLVAPKVVEEREFREKEHSTVGEQRRTLDYPTAYVEDTFVRPNEVTLSNSFGSSGNGQLRRCVNYADLQSLDKPNGCEGREPAPLNVDDSGSLETIWEVDDENNEDEF